MKSFFQKLKKSPPTNKSEKEDKEPRARTKSLSPRKTRKGSFEDQLHASLENVKLSDFVLIDELGMEKQTSLFPKNPLYIILDESCFKIYILFSPTPISPNYIFFYIFFFIFSKSKNGYSNHSYNLQSFWISRTCLSRKM